MHAALTERSQLPTSSALQRAVRLGLTFGAIVALVVLEVPLCPLAATTGIPCPGCGLTRATLAALHGELHHAWRLHPLVFVVAPVVALAALINGVSYVRFGKWHVVDGWSGRWSTLTAAVLGLLLVGVWLARFLGAFGGPAPV